MKKLLSLALAIVLLLSLTAVAFAAEHNYSYKQWGGRMDTQRNGSNNNQVIGIQRVLQQLGYGLTVDGAFGSSTTSKVKTYQSNIGQTNDGIVGRYTWDGLRSELRFYGNDPSGINDLYNVRGNSLAYFQHTYDGYWQVNHNSAWRIMK